MKSVAATAFAAGVLAAAGCQSVGDEGMEAISLVAGAVSTDRPPGFETTIQPAGAASYRTVTFRGPARRRGDFNFCTVQAVAIAPEDMKGRTTDALAATAARGLHAVHQTIGGLHDLSLGEPAPGRANDPWAVRSVDRTLRRSERYWGVSSAGGHYLIVQHCQTGGSPEELAAIEKLTRPLFSEP